MPISTPTQITVPFATSGLKNAIPAASDPVTGKAGYDQGFTAINMTPRTAGGIPPYGQDMNGIFFDISTAIQFLEAGGSFPYNSTFATAVGGYPLGALVSRTDGTGLWRNTVANNTTDPETFGAGWQPENAGSSIVPMTNANVTLTALQAARSIIVITGTITANIQLVLPTYIKQWLVINNGTGSFSVTVKTASGSGVAIGSGANRSVYGDGTNILPLAITIPPPLPTNLSASIPTASASATFNADYVTFNTVANGQAYTARAFSQAINISTVGAGGMDSAGSVATTWIAVYAIFNPVTQVSALLGVNIGNAVAPNICAGVMPSGYTSSCYLSTLRTTAGSLFEAGQYQLGGFVGHVDRTAVNSGTPASLQSTLIQGNVPANAKTVNLRGSIASSGAGVTMTYGVSATGTTGSSVQANGSTNGGGGSGSSGILGKCLLVTPQTIYYSAAVGAGTMSFNLISSGYDLW